jgi:hypothetical protein
VVIQWIPSHCGIPGNRTTGTLAKEGCRLPQTDISTTYGEAKVLIKCRCWNKWETEHLDHTSSYAYYQISREDQVMITWPTTIPVKYKLFGGCPRPPDNCLLLQKYSDRRKRGIKYY